MAEKQDKPGKHAIHIDGVKYDVTDASMLGRAIKALAGKDAQYQLFLEQQGNDPDKLVGDDEAVAIKSGMHFYTVPPATFGSRG
jgi:hypothetical protein